MARRAACARLLALTVGSDASETPFRLALSQLVARVQLARREAREAAAVGDVEGGPGA